VAKASFVRPIVPESLEPSYNESQRNPGVRNELRESQPSPREVNTSMNDLTEVPSKRCVSQITHVNNLYMIYHEFFKDRSVYVA
jgi:hypothetical protein